MEYTLDVAAAKQADQTGKFIKETGKYKGVFTKAEALSASTGTKGIAFTFESEAKQTANFSVYTTKADGEKLRGYQTVMALMVCMGLRAVKPAVVGKATKYDFDAKQDVQYDAPLLLDLMNKPIGVILQLCEYAKEKDRVPTGEFGWKIELQGAFASATELTATEILASKTKPEMLGVMISNLADRPLKNKTGGSGRPAQGYQGGTGLPDSFGSDIPDHF